MVEVWLPYGETEVPVKIPSENLQAVVKPNDKPPFSDVDNEIRRLLAESFGQADSTINGLHDRPVAISVPLASSPPSVFQVIKVVVDWLRGSISSLEGIRIIRNSGWNGDIAHDDVGLEGLIGSEIHYVTHDPSSSECIELGATSAGTPIKINREFAESATKILITHVAPHFYAGFWGGPFELLPGLASSASKSAFHSLATKNLGWDGDASEKDLQRDCLEASDKVRIDLSISVVTDPSGRVVGLFGGQGLSGFEQAVKMADEVYRVSNIPKSDILVVSAGGTPHDLNLQRAATSLFMTADTVRDGGAIVLAAEASEGAGDEEFQNSLVEGRDQKQAQRSSRKKINLSTLEAYSLAALMQRVKLYLVSAIPDCSLNRLKIRTARTANAAFSLAQRYVGDSRRVTVIPYGSTTLRISS